MSRSSRSNTKQLGFAPTVTVEVQQEQVLLTSFDNYVVLEGELCSSLIPLLKQDVAIEKIVAQLSDRFPPEEVYFTLMRLEEDGFLIENDTHLESNHVAFWSSMGYTAHKVESALPDANCAVHSFGIPEASGIREALSNFEIRSEPSSKRILALTSNYLHPELDFLHARAFDEKCSIFMAKVLGPVIWLGPVIQPGQTACLACLSHRLEQNQPAEMYKRERGIQHGFDKVVPAPEPVRQIGEKLIALEVVKWILSDEPYHLENALMTFDLRTLETRRHFIVKRPQCPVCGEQKEAESSLYSLSPAWVTREQGFRIRSSHQTVSNLQKHISPITGVVRTIKRVEDGDGLLMHNYSVGHSSRRRKHSIESLRLATRDESGGKGATDMQSKASGLCEALERYSALYDDDVGIVASYNELQDEALNPASFLLFSEKQYASREEWNAGQSGHFQLVPEPFDEKKSISWVPVFSLDTHTRKYIPTSSCYYGFDGPGSEYCAADSNGLASGNSLEEAILYGFLELAERDAVSMWWYNRFQRPGVDHLSFGDPYLISLTTYYKSIDRDLWVLDVSNDLGIPTFVAVSPRLTHENEDILLGFGAHFDAKTAVTRAILEVNQSLPAVLRSRSERRRQLLPDFADVVSWWDHATVAKHRYLVPQRDVPFKTAGQYEHIDRIDLKELISQYSSRLQALGMDIYVRDLTRSDIGLSVARVVVPGMRHFWRRLAAGRLYNVPVHLGWIEEMLAEDTLNPVSLFL